VTPEVEAAILDYALKHPTHGPQRVSNELRLQGVEVGSSGVRGVWLRHDQETRHKRLLRLEVQSQETTYVLSEEQIVLLERHSVDFRCRHVESSRPGELLNQDTFYWGTLKGVGKVYVQVVVDVFCSLAFAKVYTSKMPVTACDLLYDRVLPFYEALGVQVGAILSDNGREFCGREETHPYELLLSMEGIEHRTTRVRSLRTNGFVERMNRTLLDECFRVAGRQTWYIEPDEIQRDLDVFLEEYNLRRTHQGYRLKGRTPAQALCEALGIEELPTMLGISADETEGELPAA
jgi:transposase InsO family protein